MWMKSSFVLLAAVLVLAMVSNAEAQRGGGNVGVSHVQLAGAEEVQKELKLSDDQKGVISEISEKFREARQEIFQNRGQGDFAEMREKLAKLTNESAAKVKDALSDEQKERLSGIYAQMNGVSALMDAEIAKAVKITDEQREKLAAARQKAMEAIRDAARDLRDAEQGERREAMAKLREKWDQDVMANLSDEQKELFEKLKGEKIEIDRSQFRMRRRNQ